MGMQERKPTQDELDRLRVRTRIDSNERIEHINGVPVTVDLNNGKPNQQGRRTDALGKQFVYRTEKQDMYVQGIKLTWAKLELVKLLIEGNTVKDCARAIGVSGNTCRTYLKDPEVLRTLKELSETKYREVVAFAEERQLSLRERTLSLADEALDEMERLLADSNDAIKFKVAQDILDRNGEVSRVQKQIGEHKHIHVDAETLMNAAKAASELGGKHKPTLISAEQFDQSKEEGEGNGTR